MEIVRRIVDYTNLIVTLGTFFGIVISTIFFFSWRAKTQGMRLKSYLHSLYKNLPEKSVDSFDLGESLKTRMTYPIEGCLGRIRVTHGSSKEETNPSIRAHVYGGKLTIDYAFSAHNTDDWISYVIQGFGDEMQEYIRKGYYLSFTVSSKDISQIVLETRSPELKTNIHIPTQPKVYYYKLSELILNTNNFVELCFVIRPFPENRLEGSIEIADLRLVKKPSERSA